MVLMAVAFALGMILITSMAVIGLAMDFNDWRKL